MRRQVVIALASSGAGILCACGSSLDDSRAANDVEVVDPGAARWQASSQTRLYRITIGPEEGRARLGPMHTWLVEVASREGKPVTPIHVLFDGGMPEHGHGFETSPRVIDSPGRGVVRVDGVRFQMAGAWRIRIDVASREGADFALFDLEVEP